MKIGPLDLERGSVSAYVAYGEQGLDVVLEATDGKGLTALKRRTNGEALVCEPTLGPSAAKHGFAVAELPAESVALKAALAVTLDHGPALKHVPPELVLELIMATLELDAAAPWEVFGPDEPIAIRFEPGGREVEGCVMGHAGEEYGLALYHHKGSLKKALALGLEGRFEAARSLASTAVLISDDDSCAIDAIRAMTGVATAPVVFHTTRGNVEAASAQDVAHVVAALRAVTALSAGGQQASGHVHDGMQRIVARATRSAIRPRFEGLGRNEPCPCGSGKKFKRCHLGADVAETRVAPSEAIHARDNRLVADILAFGARRFGGEATTRALAEMFGAHVATNQLADPLLAFTCLIDGKPLGAHFLEAQRARLDANDRRWIESQLATRTSVWEVLQVERGRGLELIDLVSGERCFVHEVLGTETLVARDAILARVAAGDVAVICGVHDTPLGPCEAEEIVQGLRAGPVALDGHALAARLIALWHEQLAATARKAALPMRFTNTDGHEVATVQDHYRLATGGFEVAFERLAALDGAHVDEHDRKGASITFTRHADAGPKTILGSARLTATRLITSTNSSERGDALRDRVRHTLGELAAWRKRTREELPARLGGETLVLDSHVTDSPSVRDAYREWLDTPIKALDGRTPRAAVRDEVGRRTVHVLLKEMERRHGRKPTAGFDPGELRRELALDQLGEALSHAGLHQAIGGGRKLSETILDFAGPLLDAGGGLADERTMRVLLGFAILVWNFVATEESRGTAGGAAALRAELGGGRIPADILAWGDQLVARKRGLFAGDLRMVGNWDVVRKRDLFDVQMETRVPEALYAKLIDAGLQP